MYLKVRGLGWSTKGLEGLIPFSGAAICLLVPYPFRTSGHQSVAPRTHAMDQPTSVEWH